ncbi:MAG: tRNA pseudouridine(55) synthase TruB [Acholeplasmataceae bacterium]|nr:tRNA pseudouridine(55) synthase TruB [Acholeplasmataceae bacterium]
MDGFLLINKPKGLTSHDVVYKVKKKLKIDKIGHTGTLDPFASGLLILCLGKATKLAYLFSNLDKAYEGTVVFGNHYDTYDTTGTILNSNQPSFNQIELERAVSSMVGTYDQIPPMYSAIKMGGKKLYELAREGIEIERESRTVTIDRFDIISPLKNNEFSFSIYVSKGTYIRSIAVDLAEKLNTYAALSELKRVSVGSYLLSHAKNIEDIDNSDIISLDNYFSGTQSIVLNEYMIKLVRNGVYLDQRQIDTDKPFLVKNENGESIAYYEVIAINQYKPIIIF